MPAGRFDDMLLACKIPLASLEDDFGMSGENFSNYLLSKFLYNGACH